MKKIFVSIMFFSFISAGYAGVGYYNNYQQIIGDRAAGLGGAYTALADDSTALWYNPAGLANIKSFNLNVSANGYNYIKTGIDGYVEMEDEGGDYKKLNWRDSDISVVAHTLAYAKKLGAGAFGFGIFVPFQDDIHGIIEGEVTTSTYIMDLRYESNLSSKSIYGLAGYGGSVGSAFNYGVSVGIGYLNERAKDTYMELIEFFDDTAYNASGYYIYEASGYIIEASMGFQYYLGQSNIIGLKLSTPAYSLYYKSKEKEIEMYAGTDVLPSDPTETIFYEDVLSEKDSSFWKYYPAKVSVGYAYRSAGSFTFTFDIVPSFKTDEYPESVINYKAGVEIYFSRDLVARAGFFTDFSQKGELTEDDDFQNSIDYYGVSMGISFGSNFSLNGNSQESQKLLTTIGILYRWGSGQTKASRYDSNIDEIILIKDQTIHSYSFFVGETIHFN